MEQGDGASSTDVSGVISRGGSLIKNGVGISHPRFTCADDCKQISKLECSAEVTHEISKQDEWDRGATHVIWTAVRA